MSKGGVRASGASGCWVLGAGVLGVGWHRVRGELHVIWRDNLCNCGLGRGEEQA